MAIRTLQKNTHALYFVTYTDDNCLNLKLKTNLYDHIYDWFRYFRPFRVSARDSEHMGYILLIC